MNTPMLKWLRGGNRACLRLWRDERGSILALSVIIHLCVFMMTCGIYAVGETARKRMELQNTADAAAYAGSLVQADGLSRIAGFNRALGWVYIQLGRAQMDHAVDKWLGLTLDMHKAQQKVNETAIRNQDCADEYVGAVFQLKARHVEINERKWYEYKTLKGMHKDDARSLRRKIDAYSDMIVALNTAVRHTAETIKPQVRKTVEEVVQSNVADSPFEARNDIRYSLRHSDASAYLAPMNSEVSLIKYGTGEALYAKDVFDRGVKDTVKKVDGWYVLEVGGTGGESEYAAPGGGGSGPGTIYREYRQQDKYLKAFWRWHWIFFPGCEFPPVQDMDSQTVTGEEALARVPRRYWSSEPVRTYLVGPDFFNGLGTISVAVSRRVNNPFEQLISDKGLFRAFSVDEDRSKKAFMWAASAARAGYLDLGRGIGGSDAGNYNNTVDSHQITVHPPNQPQVARDGWRQNGWWGRRRLQGNLMIGDWDAVFLPLSRALSPRLAAWQPRGPHASVMQGPFTPGEWVKDSAAELLGDFWSSAEWFPVVDRGIGGGNGLRTWASDQAPAGMSGRQSYSTTGWPNVLH